MSKGTPKPGSGVRMSENRITPSGLVTHTHTHGERTHGVKQRCWSRTHMERERMGGGAMLVIHTRGENAWGGGAVCVCVLVLGGHQSVPCATCVTVCDGAAQCNGGWSWHRWHWPGLGWDPRCAMRGPPTRGAFLSQRYGWATRCRSGVTGVRPVQGSSPDTRDTAAARWPQPSTDSSAHVSKRDRCTGPLGMSAAVRGRPAPDGEAVPGLLDRAGPGPDDLLWLSSPVTSWNLWQKAETHVACPTTRGLMR